MAALLLLLIASQVIYEWTDAEGTTHYTDDVTTVPKGVRARVSGSPEAPRRAGDTPDASTPAVQVVRPARAVVDTCAKGRAEVSSAEQAISRLEAEPDPGERCTAQLNATGSSAYATTVYAQCMADRARVLEQRKGRLDAAKQRLEAARDSLRRAQAAGCE